ncbi:peptidase 1 [Auriculariales sp. MPI-PUGE-AT-0066]|nr:peptidase 1 [Auriculariales sp. MPI-PUGE-AT-0066]
MQFTFTSLVTLALALAASAAPGKLLTVQKYGGQKVPGSYIVRLKEGVNKDALLDSDPALRESVTHADWTIINGFAGQLSAEQLNELRANDQVESIQEDGVVSIQAAQTNAAWGLGRISHTNPVSGTITALNYTYTYSDTYQGQGVDIYIVDTGINLNHVDFTGRVKFGWTGTGLNQTDDHGHGSHVAGIAAGTRYGVAKQANLISVKVLDSAGSGTLANVVGGFNYVGTAAKSTGRPSLASASLGGSASTSIDDAVSALTSAGIHVVVAASNSNVNAANTSPARVASAITVGAIGQSDEKASFSNYGAIVDIWAPGVSITSAGASGTSSTIVYSGTSQATPHVTGLGALYLSQYGSVSPAVLSSSIWSQSGKITGLPSGSNNRLAVGPILI